MATYQETMPPVNLPAGADLSTKQYLAVDVNSSGQLAVVGTLGAKGVGILQDKPDAAGVMGAVAVIGSGVTTKWVASTTITAGAKLTSANSGKAVTAGSGEHVYGIALESATAADDVIQVLLVSVHILA